MSMGAHVHGKSLSLLPQADNGLKVIIKAIRTHFNFIPKVLADMNHFVPSPGSFFFQSADFLMYGFHYTIYSFLLLLKFRIHTKHSLKKKFIKGLTNDSITSYN